MKIKICNINDYSDFSKLSLLTKERQEQILRFVLQEDKKRCYCAGILLLEEFGEKSKEVQIDEYGKPFLLNENLFFNISHCGDYVVLVCNEKPIGVDIEKFIPISISEKIQIINQVFSTQEIEWLKSHNLDKDFYKLWTAKESVVKLIGKGFLINSKSFSVLPIENGLHKINDESYFLYWHEFDNYIICSASKNEAKKNLFCDIKY